MSPTTSWPAENPILQPRPVKKNPTFSEFDSRTEEGHRIVEEGRCYTAEIPNSCPRLKLSSHMKELFYEATLYYGCVS